MRTPSRAARRAALAATTVLTLTGLLAGCADEGGSTTSGGGGAADPDQASVAFLMPDLASTRYELYDAPLFTDKMGELCPDCTVIYQNADSSAATQQEQANSALAQGASAIVLDPVDSAAAATIVQTAQSQGVPVIAYDRPIPDRAADFYVSFDNEAIGASIAESLVEYLDAEGIEGGLLQVNGSPTDAAAGLIKDGATGAVESSDFEVLAEYDTPDWTPSRAQDWVSGQVSKYGDDIAGVVAANDGTGGGAIAAFKAAGAPVPPVTGNDFELAAAQRIVAGDQFNTISKPIKTVAEAAADVAWAFVNGEEPEADTTLFDTPSQLFEPTVVTQDNLAEVLEGPDAPFTVEDVCTAEYRDDCERLGLL